MLTKKKNENKKINETETKPYIFLIHLNFSCHIIEEKKTRPIFEKLGMINLFVVHDSSGRYINNRIFTMFK